MIGLVGQWRQRPVRENVEYWPEKINIGKMSERVGKIGLNAGTPWSLFAENTAFEDSQGIISFVAIHIRPFRPAYCH